MNTLKKIEGLDKMTDNFAKITKGMDDEVITDAYLNVGRKMASQMKRRIRSHRVTGNLEKGIVAKKFKYATKSGGRNHEGTGKAFVAINYRYAPHAHLIEFGHKSRLKPDSENPEGKLEFVPAHPFFRITVDEFTFNKDLESEVAKAVEKALDKALR